MEQKYYLEKRIKKFGIVNQTIARKLTKGTIEMLNAFPEKEQLVKFRSVDITYGSGKNALKAISDLNLNIYKGEVLSLVGESGSGKSTTGSALAALTSHSFGSITIGNEVLPHKTTKINGKLNNYLVANVQMIFQDPVSSLNPHKNIFKVVSEGIDNLELKTKGGIKSIFFQNFDENVFRSVVDILTKDNNWTKEKQEKTLNDFFSLIENNKDYATQFLYNEFIFSLTDKNVKNASDFIQSSLEIRKQKEGLSTAKLKHELILEMLKSVGLDESVLKRFPLEFSGGQQQRIGISRALVLRPKLLIADEPISALDVSIQAQVINIFKDLKQKYNLTILFISHDLRMVEYISDRIAVINKGKLLEIGPTEEIMNNFLHPYTKSLMEAIPTIDSKGESLLGYIYDPKIHEYSDREQPEWINLGNNHFVLATKKEVSEWKKGVYK